MLKLILSENLKMKFVLENVLCVCGKRGKLNKRNQSKITTIPKCVGLCLPSPQTHFLIFFFSFFVFLSVFATYSSICLSMLICVRRTCCHLLSLDSQIDCSFPRRYKLNTSVARLKMLPRRQLADLTGLAIALQGQISFR